MASHQGAPQSSNKAEQVEELPKVQSLENRITDNEPVGIVFGEPVFEKPKDLYIPPDALELLLESFAGPMDLLLYLIRRQKMDILDLPILPITQQYMEYVALMHEINLELAADYLVMAAILAEIKSRMLLPAPPTEEEEEDPRAELIRRLQAYEIVRAGAQELDEQAQQDRDFFVAQANTDAAQWIEESPPEVSIEELVLALARVMKWAKAQQSHQVKRENFSTRERMSQILLKLQAGKKVRFEALFNKEEGKAGVVVSFLALLELTKEGLVQLMQVKEFEAIYVTQTATDAKHYADN